MPELPEVETVCRTLAPRLIGQRIAHVHLGEYRRCIACPDPEEFVTRLTGAQIERIGRRGKFILIKLDTEDIVTIHLRMTGELIITSPDEPIRPHLHLYLELENGLHVRWYDTRKFGRWSLLTPDEYRDFNRKLGAEPLDPHFTGDEFTEMLQRKQRILKPLLLDQTFIVGIGNIYADEALFRAGIHPQRRSNSLTQDEATRLFTQIQLVLNEALQHRGTTLRDYRDGDGQPGNNLGSLQIYSRVDGDPCPKCGGPVQRMVIGQRGTKLCPRCQPFVRKSS